MADTQTRMPGVLFRNVCVAQHNDRLLAHWLMIGGDGAVIAPGVSFARFEGERLIEMNGFFPTPVIVP